MARDDVVVRALVAGLLSSNLSRRELLELTNELPHKPQLLRLIANAVRSVLNASENDVQEKEERPRQTFSTRDKQSAFKEIMAIVGRRRMPKAEVLSILSMWGSVQIPRDAIGRTTIREIVERFVATATKENIDRARFALLGHYEEDPYLKGITQPR